MAFRKKNQPGCACCSGPCTPTTFTVLKCCGTPSSGATVTIKNGSTVVGTGTTNSSGVVTIDLSAYSSVPTLTVTVSYQPTYYQQYTNVLLGSQCGRNYVYTLAIIGSRSGATCGTIIITTTACNGTTILGGKAWTLYKASAGGFAPYTSGTTDSSTGKSTISGLTYGGAFDGYRFIVTDAAGTIVGTSFTLTSANCVASVVMRMATVAGSPCATPNDTVTLSGSGGGLTFLNCCQDCDPITVPSNLTLVDPGIPNYFTGIQTNPNLNYGCGTTSGTIPLTVSTYMGGPYIPGCSMWNGYDYGRYSKGYSVYGLSCTGSGIKLSVSNGVLCGYQLSIAGRRCLVIKPGGGVGGQGVDYGGPISPASLTCSPFSATFNLPSVTLTMYDEWFEWPPGVLHSDPCGSYTIPARTITITE